MFRYLLLLAVSEVSSRVLPCLDDCICEQTEEHPLIRCENGDRQKIEIPNHAMPGYQYIAFICNDLRELPQLPLLKAAFPDIQGIDIQGNPLFNCSSLGNIREEIAVLTDCDPDTTPITCNIVGEDCDWKCKTLNKLRELWKKVKKAFVSRIKEWGGEEAMNEISNWFSKTFQTIAASLSH
ncbi:hypothetical protein KIN20_005442 [Parelaphostrongylus tenuis]|uniref:Uncharacterized protein n=1 Tax=Parelaphostrongylus tenuis TaxID=148309 RepID=A0AAD5MIJ4_PARTN|nr:hypothetical protein KIN20_005442 [Parelaphostrongylus tenuis]